MNAFEHEMLNKIYNTAFDPQQWPEVLQLLQQEFQSTASGLYVQDRKTHAFRSVQLSGFDDSFRQSYAEYYSSVNPWFGPDCIMSPGRILTDETLDQQKRKTGYTVNTEFYNDWMKPQDFRYRMGGTLFATGNQYVNFTYVRPARSGPYLPIELQKQSCYTQHLIKALKINQRLEKLDLKLHAAAVSLDWLPAGVIFVDKNGKVTYANRFANNLDNQRSCIRFSGKTLTALHHDANQRLQRLIARVTASDRSCLMQEPTSLRLPRLLGSQDLLLLAIPVPDERLIFDVEHPAAIIFITDPEHEIQLDQQYLQKNYNLNAQEASIVAALIAGMSTRLIARECNISYETVRWYLKKIYEKTGTNSQKSLVRLLVSDLVSRKDTHLTL